MQKKIFKDGKILKIWCRKKFFKLEKVLEEVVVTENFPILKNSIKNLIRGFHGHSYLLNASVCSRWANNVYQFTSAQQRRSVSNVICIQHSRSQTQMLIFFFHMHSYLLNASVCSRWANSVYQFAFAQEASVSNVIRYLVLTLSDVEIFQFLASKTQRVKLQLFFVYMSVASKKGSIQRVKSLVKRTLLSEKIFRLIKVVSIKTQVSEKIFQFQKRIKNLILEKISQQY